MPVYEYLCDSCGDFTEMRPMAEYKDPQPCPDCGTASKRVMLTAPHFSGMSRESMAAHATNERASNTPMTTGEYKAKHPSSCSCCSGGMKSRTKKKDGTAASKTAAKSFPNARPWMISH